ncbi:CheR family methyltransferase [Sandaracinus amylolyticus]|uniref:protein-glutamate O-methyltransferase n=1 Tax=Sandaracinus amylolyticus TaxID=927083 RepID=A0A0F6W6K5_9BACT|nr:protein-glutamate O-methyltransferase CheR [Sandaracinus amylolyticus]AKF08565.1 Chemotaxis protein methyltransferase CheR [Sandaracinus amylolyticus]
MSILFDSGPKLKIEEFRLLRDLVNRYSGMHFDDASMFVFERRLRDRLRALDLPDFTAYYHHLRYHPSAPAELEDAVEALVTNETYFFREEYQLRAFRNDLLPSIYEQALSRGTKRIMLWSAGCSTGEEVYTLAILVARSGLFDGWDVRVFGNDISRRVLATARRAVYPPSSFRAMPPEYAEFFVEEDGGMRVIPRIRAMCQFGHLNLLDGDKTTLLGRVDAIFCRNVLIYFDTASRKKVIDTFYERLHPGGHLLLGHSESLLHVSTAFELAHLSSDMVYRRPLEGSARARRDGGER